MHAVCPPGHTASVANFLLPGYLQPYLLPRPSASSSAEMGALDQLIEEMARQHDGEA